MISPFYSGARSTIVAFQLAIRYPLVDRINNEVPLQILSVLSDLLRRLFILSKEFMKRDSPSNFNFGTLPFVSCLPLLNAGSNRAPLTLVPSSS